MWPFYLERANVGKYLRAFQQFCSMESHCCFSIHKFELGWTIVFDSIRNDRNSNFITVKEKFMHARRLRQKNLSVLQIFLRQINTVILWNGPVFEGFFEEIAFQLVLHFEKRIGLMETMFRHSININPD